MNALLTSVAELIGPDMLVVERLFHDELQSDISPVNTLVKHVGRFRGKMLRPSLVLLAGKACGDLTNAHHVIATVVEMIHMSTLVHDDVLDEAELRRKGATINHLRGNEAAVLLGDYLISHAFHLCSSLDSQSASRAIGKTTNEVCEGELLQIDNRHHFDLDEATYYRIIDRKTASLIATSCVLGARFAGASKEDADRLETFGRSIGVAFQIQDDILDIVGDAAEVGKTLGIDVEKGKMTLPMIHFMNHAPAEHRRLLRMLLESKEPDKAERIRNLIVPSDSIPYARAQAARHIDCAKQSLLPLPDTDAKRLLTAMADFVLARPV